MNLKGLKIILVPRTRISWHETQNSWHEIFSETIFRLLCLNIYLDIWLNNSFFVTLLNVFAVNNRIFFIYNAAKNIYSKLLFKI